MLNKKTLLEVVIGVAPICIVWGTMLLLGFYGLLSDAVKREPMGQGDAWFLLFGIASILGLAALIMAVFGRPAEQQSKSRNRVVLCGLLCGFFVLAYYLGVYVYHLITPQVESEETLAFQLTFILPLLGALYVAVGHTRDLIRFVK